MEKKKIIIISVISVVVIALGFYIFKKESPKNAFRLETTKMSLNKITTSVTATGTIDPITEITVGTQVSGIISKIYVDYNSVVKKGQILAELDKTNLQSDYNSQLLNLNSSKTQYDFQKKNFDRSKELHDKNLISDIDFETAKYNYELAESTYKLNQTNLKKAQTNLNYATIYSPIDGVIVSRAVEQGQTVAASFSTPTLFDIAQDLTKMQVVANVDEADIGNVKEGQRVTFTVDAFPNDQFSGKVTQVRLKSTVTSNVVTYQVVVNTTNKDLKLKPGLTANITIYTVEKSDVQTLPNKVFSFKPDMESLKNSKYTIFENKELGKTLKENERIVWVQDGNTIKNKIVAIGDADMANTEITSGLSNDELVVLDQKSLTDDSSTPNDSSEKSPFMPNFKGRNGSKK
ncbi:MAG: efflux RND transporter periplasmic adaptor subunit [Paludibacter sp.]|nr:efflux RND transporter periplasmic adaptor subunit [Paludibacter sp.]